MKNSLRTIFRILLAIIGIVALVFAAEALLYWYDMSRSTLTTPNAVVAEGGLAKEGLNRRIFREDRFRPCNISLRLTVKQILDSEARVLPQTVAGRMTVKKKGSSVEYCALDFRLEECKPEATDGAKEGRFRRIRPQARPYAAAGKADYDYMLMPVTDLDRIAFSKISKSDFEQGEELTIDIVMSGPVPRTAAFEFVYSRAAKSIFHGTPMKDLTKVVRPSGR